VSAAAVDSTTAEIPLFPLNLVLFPDGPLPLRIFETRYVDMVRRCMRESSEFGVVLIRKGQETGPAETFDVGTTAGIIDFHQLADGFLGLSCVGRRRFRIKERSLRRDGLNVAVVEFFNDSSMMGMPAQHESMSELIESVLPQLGEPYSEMRMQLDDATWVGQRLAEILPIPVAQKQYCLECSDPIQRLDFLSPLTQASA
jgi:Lon protease-like protein